LLKKPSPLGCKAVSLGLYCPTFRKTVMTSSALSSGRQHLDAFTNIFDPYASLSFCHLTFFTAFLMKIDFWNILHCLLVILLTFRKSLLRLLGSPRRMHAEEDLLHCPKQLFFFKYPKDAGSKFLLERQSLVTINHKTTILSIFVYMVLSLVFKSNVMMEAINVFTVSVIRRQICKR
jgi:hypothetical protein